MKKRNIYFLGLALLCGTTSCVDLDQEPESFLTEEEYIEQPQTIDIVQKGVTGLYNLLWSENYGFSCRRLRIETSAGEILPQFAKAGNPLTNIYALSPSIGSCEKDNATNWKNFWKVITGSNKIINGTPIPEGAQAEQYKAIVAEAHFMRALAYFNLVRIFGDVPFITNSEEARNPECPRCAVADIYDKIILPDLEYACKYLPKVSRSLSSDTPSLWAGKTLLADVYITMAGWPLKRGKEYYAKAADVTKEIITNSGLKLTADYADLWKEELKISDKEHLFALHNSVALHNPSQYGKSFYSTDHKYGGWGDYFASPRFVENHPHDARLAYDFALDWPKNKAGEMINYKNSINKAPLIVKFADYNEINAKGVLSQLSNGITPIYRYADVLLMYAEASNLAEGAPNKLAQQCLKDIQDRAGYPTNERPAYSDMSTFDQAVFQERGWEFYAEGKRWFELVRREKVAEYRNMGTMKPGDKGIKEEYENFYDNSLFKANGHYYFPLPIAEVQMTGWENNKGY